MREARFWMATALLGFTSAATSVAFPADRAGKSIVDEVCAACHGTGLEGAPRIGDRKAWSARAARGLSSLTKSAMEGVRKMPPHGGRLGLDDMELKRAITYMVKPVGRPLDRAHRPRAATAVAHRSADRRGAVLEVP